jgi:hypothetical protein
MDIQDKVAQCYALFIGFEQMIGRVWEVLQTEPERDGAAFAGAMLNMIEKSNVRLPAETSAVHELVLILSPPTQARPNYTRKAALQLVVWLDRARARGPLPEMERPALAAYAMAYSESKTDNEARQRMAGASPATWPQITAAPSASRRPTAAENAEAYAREVEASRARAAKMSQGWLGSTNAASKPTVAPAPTAAPSAEKVEKSRPDLGGTEWQVNAPDIPVG